MNNNSSSWSNKILYLRSASVQVKRSLNSDSNEELILGFTSAAIALEAFVNFFTHKYIKDDNIFKSFTNLKLHQRIMYLPRFCHGETHNVVNYEKSKVHEKYRKLISFRNKLVHGAIKNINLKDISKSNLLNLWNEIINLFLEMVSALTGETVLNLENMDQSFKRLQFTESNGVYNSEFLSDYDN